MAEVIYCRIGMKVSGPFSAAQFKQLLGANKIPVMADVSQTPDGPWENIALVLARGKATGQFEPPAPIQSLPTRQLSTDVLPPASHYAHPSGLIAPGETNTPSQYIQPYELQPYDFQPQVPTARVIPGQVHPMAGYQPILPTTTSQQPQIIYVQAPAAPAPVINVVNNNTVGSHNTAESTSGCAWIAAFGLMIFFFLLHPALGILMLLVLAAIGVLELAKRS
ncbi:MAG: hypothetical protein SGJ20_01005 [Planctomycetota bacterium]|nr:hypothetical protein [Planctomycetota bacterium]